MKFTIKTIGCKVNTYESMKIRDELCKLGFSYVDVEDKDSYKDLDFYIVNTCSVTKIADKKSRQMIHLAKKYNENVKVIAIGCMVDSLKVGADASAAHIVRDDVVGADASAAHIVRGDVVGAKHCEPASVGASYASPLSGVDYIISNKEKSNLAEFISSLVWSDASAAHAVRGDVVGADASAAHIVRGDDAHTTRGDVVGADTIRPTRIRAFIKIQDGCNQYCTYCIIPFLRGNIKSRDNQDIISEIKEKVKNGVKEIVLTGIHLSSFGLDRVNKTYESDGAIEIARKELLTIMKQVSEIDGVERIRLGSLEPRIIDEYFLINLIGTNAAHTVRGDNVGTDAAHKVRGDGVGASNIVGAKHCEPEVVRASCASPLSTKFCANFCLSLQSGCDKTLKRMNRHYTTSEYEKACKLIREYMPYATITTDVIVGFPGETEEDFAQSLEFVKRMRFYNPNIFPYSRRQGTKADKMPDQLSNEEKHKRSIHMISECEKISKEIEEDYFKNYKDKASDVLIEEYEKIDGNTYGIGYTKEYIKIKKMIG